MSDLMIIDEAELKAASPQDVAQMIIEATQLIDGSRMTADEIRSRAFFKRLFSNNTRDIANAMLDQNRAMAMFLKMLQTTIWLNLNNTVVLAQISEELNKQEQGRGNHQNKYVEIARSFISQTYASAVAFKEQFDNLFTTTEALSGTVATHATELTSLRSTTADLRSTTHGQMQAIQELNHGASQLRNISHTHSQEITTLGQAHSDTMAAVERSLGELHAAGEERTSRIAQLEQSTAEIARWREQHIAQTEQHWAALTGVERGLREVAAGWDTGARNLADTARTTRLLTIAGLSVGLCAWLGLAYILLTK